MSRSCNGIKMDTARVIQGNGMTALVSQANYEANKAYLVGIVAAAGIDQYGWPRADTITDKMCDIVRKAWRGDKDVHGRYRGPAPGWACASGSLEQPASDETIRQVVSHYPASTILAMVGCNLYIGRRIEALEALLANPTLAEDVVTATLGHLDYKGSLWMLLQEPLMVFSRSVEVEVVDDGELMYERRVESMSITDYILERAGLLVAA
jgi:hypothetical protein